MYVCEKSQVSACQPVNRSSRIIRLLFMVLRYYAATVQQSPFLADIRYRISMLFGRSADKSGPANCAGQTSCYFRRASFRRPYPSTRAFCALAQGRLVAASACVTVPNNAARLPRISVGQISKLKSKITTKSKIGNHKSQKRHGQHRRRSSLTTQASSLYWDLRFHRHLYPSAVNGATICIHPFYIDRY